MVHPSPLLAPADLAATPERFRVLDASWIYPPMNRAGIEPRRRYADAHVPGALFLDLAALSLPYPAAADVPALRPPHAESLRRLLAEAAIDPATPLVVTDGDGGTTTAPFARLALLDAGFTDVRVLEGGNPGWAAAGLPLTGAQPRLLQGIPRAADAEGRFVGTAATRRAIAEGTGTVVDARALATNEGILPKRYAEASIPTHAVLRPGDVVAETAAGQCFRAAREIDAVANAQGITADRQSIVTCYFGVGAAVVATALEIAGHPTPTVDAASILGWANGVG